jgi:hypothetical protein
MRSPAQQSWWLTLALAAAAVVAGLQAWGWGDAAGALAAGAGWLWRAGWPVVRVAVLPVAAGGALYLYVAARLPAAPSGAPAHGVRLADSHAGDCCRLRWPEPSCC